MSEHYSPNFNVDGPRQPRKKLIAKSLGVKAVIQGMQDAALLTPTPNTHPTLFDDLVPQQLHLSPLPAEPTPQAKTWSRFMEAIHQEPRL